MTAPVFVGDFEPGSSEWHAARAHGIGGSEIAAVLGLSPWESRFSLWHRKKGLVAPVAQNDVMYWGTRLEEVIREEFNLRHAGELSPAVTVGTWRHAARPWQIANPDGKLDGALYEGKTAYNDDGWGEEGTEEIPVYYRTQCLWYLDVFGLNLCHVAVLISGSDYREYYVERANDEMALMRERAAEFLDTLRENQRPNIDEHDATYAVVRELHPDIDDVKFDVPGYIAVPYLDALDAHKAAVAEKQRATTEVLDAMGTARRAMFDGEQIAMRVAGRGDNPPSLRATPSKKTPGLKVSAA
ncbi:YqaJ viral recombinase family protein [Amycolatopsis sp., V23-08]|uniref:YqaJ viral recombinase family protein n=1 Tax=Amycolatopsis heterodermiae TaxID=3110235 RepID=A0ABU5RKF2_9PSEU|nr:YqaJ viral recombinase family protein [Amycolatopsis sp., V23-08]MEA5366049.1 YqaJ viral recombinase family protein [Amycolatopsis sp., V23-08]